MSLSNIEEVGASLPDVQSREMQILEEQNDANVQQNFNNRTCSVCNKDATENGKTHAKTETMSKIYKQKSKSCKQNYPKQTESQLKTLRKSTD